MFNEDRIRGEGMEDKSMDIEYIKTAVKESLNKLYSESSLIPRLNERAIAFRFAHHLANFIESDKSGEEIVVDSEYGKDMDREKVIYENCSECDELNCELKKEMKTNELKETHCYPDVIIHKREEHENDICAIEIKRISNSDAIGRKNDHTKLVYFTCSKGIYKYKYGIFLDIGKDNCELTYYVQGDKSGVEVVSKHNLG